MTTDYLKHYEPVGIRDNKAYQPATTPSQATQNVNFGNRVLSNPNLHKPSSDYEPVTKPRENYATN
jgi:hypothetical protein